MSNVSYCKFENTLADLEDCIRTLREGGREITEGTETNAAKDLVALILEFANDIGEDCDPAEYIAERTEEKYHHEEDDDEAGKGISTAGGAA